MPFKQWAVGEEMLAADFQTHVANQAVAQFANAGARTAAITAPVTGQCSTLADRPGVIQVWTGSTWADQASIRTRWVNQFVNAVVGISSFGYYEFPSFAMPTTGMLVVDLACLLTPTTPVGNQQAFVEAVAGSVGPPPSDAPQSQIQTIEAFQGKTIPVWAQWASVTAGTSVAVKIRCGTGSGGGAVLFNRLYGAFWVIPTGSTF